MCLERSCPHPHREVKTVTVEFTPEEIAALRREFFPRMLVASVVVSNDLAAQALYKLDSTALPFYKRREIENA